MNQDFNNYNEGQNQSSNMYQQPVNPNNFKTNTYVAPELQQVNNNQPEKKKNNLILIIIVLIGLILMCIGIYFVLSPKDKDLSNNNQNSNQNNQDGGVVTPPQNNDKENETENSDEITLDGMAYVGGRKITINYDATKRKDTKSNSIVFHSQMSNIVALTYDKTVTYNGTIDEVFDLLNDGDLFKNISTYTGTAFNSNEKIYSIEINSSKQKKINDFDSILIDGYVIDSNNKKALAYGYTFIIDSTPCMLIGIVIDSDSNEAIIDDLKNEVDKMAMTIREE